MKSYDAVSINLSAAQAANNGNGSNGHDHPRIIHLRRFAHYSWCGKDLAFYHGAISSAKPEQTTCRVCTRSHGKLLAMRKKARAYDRTIGRPEAATRRPGLVSVEAAMQRAVQQHAVTERHL